MFILDDGLIHCYHMLQSFGEVASLNKSFSDQNSDLFKSYDDVAFIERWASSSCVSCPDLSNHKILDIW